MQTELKERYRDLVLGGSVAQVGFIDALALRLYTGDLCRAVLAELTDELSGQASRLEARKKQLSKRLGVRN